MGFFPLSTPPGWDGGGGGGGGGGGAGKGINTGGTDFFILLQ